MAALTGLAGLLARDTRPDGELVREYAATRSDAAFAELVRRFAPLVWGVCRRTVGHRQHAEDAFQAAFLVLARKAGSVRPPAAVGGWLHAVAVHTSLRVRTMSDRRRKRHRPLDADPVSPAPAEPTDPETLRLLDEEIARLPESLRGAVALCELGGVSRREAAARLGIAEGTLSSRLASARKRLAAGLRSRGVTLAAALALASIPADAAPVVSATPSDTVSTLADGAIRAMFLRTLKLSAGVAAFVALLAAGGWLLLPAPAVAKDPPLLALKVAKPLPKPKEGLIAYVTWDKGEDYFVRVVKPDGEEVATITGFEKGTWVPFVKLSRDGKRVAVATVYPISKPGDNPDLLGDVLVYDLDTPGKPVATLATKVRSAAPVWGADANTVFLNPLVERKDAKEGEWKHTQKVVRYDVATGKETAVELPADHTVVDVSPDRKTLLVNHWVSSEKDGSHAESYLADADTLKLKRVTQQSVRLDRFSPDGTKAVGAKFTDPKDSGAQELVVFDLKEGTETAVMMGDDDTVHSPRAVWNADGSKLLVYRTVVDGVKNEKPKVVGNVGYLPNNKPEFTLRELDGTKPKPILDAKRVSWFDWR